MTNKRKWALFGACVIAVLLILSGGEPTIVAAWVGYFAGYFVVWGIVALLVKWAWNSFNRWRAGR